MPQKEQGCRGGTRCGRPEEKDNDSTGDHVFSYDGLSSPYDMNCSSATFCLSLTRLSPVILTQRLEKEVSVGWSM